MIELTLQENLAKDRICLALDYAETGDAFAMQQEVQDYVGKWKVGKELHTAANNEGVPIVEKVSAISGSEEPNVFLDLKLHDTPATVYKAAKAGTVPGVYMMDVHIAGGEEMCKKALDGVRDSAVEYGMEAPRVIGVTVLTSLDDDDLEAQGLGIGYDDLVRRRTELAREWGLDGVVCPAKKAGALEKEFGEWLYVTPGIQFGGKQGEGQKQLYTPGKAVQECSSSILVIGSAIRKANDRAGSAYAILQEMAGYL